jgi:hypothetical protein
MNADKDLNLCLSVFIRVHLWPFSFVVVRHVHVVSSASNFFSRLKNGRDYTVIFSGKLLGSAHLVANTIAVFYLPNSHIFDRIPVGGVAN